MTTVQGPVEVINTIKAMNDLTFPVVEDTDLWGGYQTVASTAERDAIPAAKLKVGMRCAVGPSVFRLSVLSPATWVADTGSQAVDSVNGETGVVVLTAGDVGADPAGAGAAAASAAVDDHEAAVDPHPQYTTTAEAQALVDTLGSAVQMRCFGITIDGGTEVVTTGVKKQVRVPFSGTITSWTLLADQVGSIVMDVWKSNFASAPPIIAGSITGSQKPTLSTLAKAEASGVAINTWTLAVTAGDVLLFVVDSASTLTSVTLEIFVDTTPCEHLWPFHSLEQEQAL